MLADLTVNEFKKRCLHQEMEHDSHDLQKAEYIF